MMNARMILVLASSHAYEAIEHARAGDQKTSWSQQRFCAQGVVGSSSGRHGLPWWCSGSGPPGTDRSSGLTLPAAAAVHDDDHAVDAAAFAAMPRCCSDEARRFVAPNPLAARPEDQESREIKSLRPVKGISHERNKEDAEEKSFGEREREREMERGRGLSKR